MWSLVHRRLTGRFILKDKLSPAVDALLEKLEEQQNAVSATKQMINQLKAMMGESPMFADVVSEPTGAGSSTRANQYYGKGPVAAAEEFLQRRNQAVPIEEIHRALEQGGFDYDAMAWKAKDRLRMLAITLAKNPPEDS